MYADLTVCFCSFCLSDVGAKLKGGKIPHEQQIKFFGKVTLLLVCFHSVMIFIVFLHFTVFQKVLISAPQEICQLMNYQLLTNYQMELLNVK